MALSGTITGKVTQNSDSFTYYAKWTATQDIKNNESTITVKHYWGRTGSATFDSTAKRRYGITINGEPFEDEKRMDYNPWVTSPISTATHTVKHNDDGTKSLTISTYANGRAGSYGPSNSSAASGDCKASETITLDPIPRAAQLLTATNFTDEKNPAITYDNPAGTAADVQVAICDTTGSTQYAKYRSIPQNGNSYTFNLTNDEKQALIKALPSGKNQMYVNIYMKTYIDGEIVENPRFLTRIFEVVNSEPEVSYTLTDVGTGSTALTNDSSVMIEGFNYITAKMTPTPKKGATILKQTITNRATVVNGASANFSNAESNEFIFYVKDSFGNEITKPVTMSTAGYIKLTCNITVNPPTADGDLAVKIHGNYFNKTFGDKGDQNELGVKWRIKENDGAYPNNWTDIPESNINVTNNTYDTTILLTGLNYKSTYTIQAMATDKVSTGGILSPERVTKSTPVYNWGENNFDINVPLTVDGSIDAKGLSTAIFNVIYPIGSIYMSADPTNPKNLFGGTWEQIKGRFLLGADATYANGSTGGAATVSLTTANLPAHNHGATTTLSATNFYIRHGAGANTDMVAQGNSTTIEEGVSSTTWQNGVSTETYSHKLDKVNINTTASTTVNNTGSGTAHNNMPPYLAVYIWKRTA